MIRRARVRRTDRRPIVIESLNARLRDELLDGEIFYTLREAEIVIESWRRHYNSVRPHASLDLPLSYSMSRAQT